MTSLQQVRQWLGAPTLIGSAEVKFTRVHTDSRSVEPGDLFVALRGERFDASRFLDQAASRGAVAVICQPEGEQRLRSAGLPGVLVTDTRLALAALARAWRAQFDLPLIAVTGSNGKTTVTQMIAAILHAFKPQAALATRGNFNNDIGVPLTLLRLRAEHEIAVLELGMNHPGEIAVLAALALPSVALVNNAQREHMEFMATVEAVALENAAVISALGASGVAVFPADDAFSATWQQLAGSRSQWRFGLDIEVASAALPVRAAGDRPEVLCTRANRVGAAWQVSAATPCGDLRYTLHAPGLHNLRNSLAAAACALAAGVPLQHVALGLGQFRPVAGRSRSTLLQHGGRSITLVDDSYNANPDSVQAAIALLAALPAPRLLVLGDMGEVGQESARYHAEALQQATQQDIQKVLVTGSAFTQAATKVVAVECHATLQALIDAVLAELPGVASVLVKGSRFMKMEQVVQALVAQHGEAAC